MSRVVFLDTGPLGMYANPKPNAKNEACRQRVNDLLIAGANVRAPGIVVYETRRKVVHLQLRQPEANRLVRFETVVLTLGLVPVTEETLRRASDIWAQARHVGHVTAPPEAIDGDVILVAQAFIESEKGDPVEIATTNSKDLIKIYPAARVLDWSDLK